jgi:hypothetical protein
MKLRVCADCSATPDSNVPSRFDEPTALVNEEQIIASARFKRRSTQRDEPGQLADLILWEHDLLTIDAASFMSVKPERTMLGGCWVYEA